MVKLQIDVSIDKYLSSTDSVVEVVVNNDVISVLDFQDCHYSGQLVLPKGKNCVSVRRKFAKQVTPKSGFLKQALSCIIVFVYFSGISKEPIECLLECQDNMEVYFNQDEAKMEINCSLHEGDLYPAVSVKCDGNECVFSSNKMLHVSDEELRNTFQERKKMIKSCILLFELVLLPFIILSLIHRNISTTFFCTVIFLLLHFCSYYSVRNLKKQCLKFKERYSTY